MQLISPFSGLFLAVLQLIIVTETFESHYGEMLEAEMDTLGRAPLIQGNL